MVFLKKHGVIPKILGITVALAIVLTSIPILNNIISVDGAEGTIENLVNNGSFEDGLSGWDKITYPDFTAIKASDAGLTAPEGDKIMKINTATRWAWREQNVTVVPNTDYEYTFWVYRPDSASCAVYKLGTNSNHTLFNPGGQQTHLNNESVGLWTKKRVVFNSGENTSVKLVFCANVGIAYIDNVSLKPVTNYIQNGSFEDGFNSWYGSSKAFSVIDASSEGITAVDGQKITKVNLADGVIWDNRSQELKLTANTDYLFSMWVYQPDSNSKLILKIGTPSSHNEFCPNKSDYNVWGKHTTKGEWFKITLPFNSGTNTNFKMHLVVSGGLIYVDDIKLQKALNVTVLPEQGGRIDGMPEGIVYTGDILNLTAVPDGAFAFDGWYVENNKISDSIEYSFIAYTDYALTAKFKPKEFELIKNGSFEDGLTYWSGNGPEFSVTDALTEEIMFNDGDKILKVALDGGTRYANRSQTATLEKNTNYLFSMWVYQPDSNSKLILKIGTPGSHNEFSPNKVDYNVWGKHTTKGEWFKISLPFNSGTETEFKMHIVVSGGVTYVDNISLKKAIKITTVADGGTVSGLPETVVQGDKITLTAVPDTGYTFDGWYKDGVRVSDTASYTLIAVSDCTMQARFESNKNLVSNGSFENGDFKDWNALSDFTVVDGGKYGAPVSKDGGKIVKAVSSSQWRYLSQFCNIEKNTNYVLGFWYYRTPNSQMTLKVGNNIADDGFVTVKWLNWDWLTVNDWTYVTFKFNSGDSDVAKLFLMTYEGTFYIDDVSLKKYYNISIATEGGGKVTSISENQLIFEGAPVTLKAEPNAGCSFEGWFENDVKISSEIELKFNAASDRNLVAKFTEADNYILDSGFELDVLHSNWINPWDRAFLSKDEAYEGEQSLHLSQTNMTNYPYIQYLISVKPNTNYMVKFMAKIPKGSSAPLLQVLGAGNTHLLNEREMSYNNFFINGGNPNAPGQGWFSVIATFNSGNNNSVKLALTGSRTAEAYIDNLVVGEAYSANITAGEHGKVPKTTVLGLKNALTTLTAIPDKNYMVEGWYIDGVKVSSEKNYQHLFTKDVDIEVRFTVSDLPIMSQFNLSKLWCLDSDNLLDDSSFELGTGVWNTSSFIKNGVLDVVELDGEKVLYFNPDGTGRQIVYFPISLAANTHYMFSANVRGKYYSATNNMDMSFGIMTKDAEYIILEEVVSGGYYNEAPNITTTKSITPPSWDNNWHRRGITFKTFAATTVWIAISGNLSEAYLDDFYLCEYNKAQNFSVEENLAKRTNINVAEDKMGCAEADNLVKNFRFNQGASNWEDGYGWQGYYSGVYIGDSGNDNKSLFMRSTTGYADRHYYIKWIDVKPNTQYTFSLAAAATSLEANYGLLVKGANRYSKLISWTSESDSNWIYKAFEFNSNDSEQVGIFVMDGGRVTALDDIRVFETSKATAINERLTGKADLPDELIIPLEDELNSEEIAESTDDQDDKENKKTTTKKIVRKKKVIKKLLDNEDSTIWWIIGGIGAAVLIVSAIVIIIILVKKKRKKAEI